MTLNELLGNSFINKINTLLSFIPPEVLTLIMALIAIIIVVALWRMVVG